MLRRVLRQGAAIVCLAMASTAVSAETIANALADAYNNSGLLAQNRAVLRAADEDVAQAASRLLPVVSWAAAATRSFPRAVGADVITGSLSLSASLTLYDAGANQLAIAAQKQLVLGTRESLRDVEQQVLFRAVQAYMSVRSTAEFISLRQNNLRVLQQELRAAQDRFDVGEVTRTDVALAQASVASAQSLLSGAQGDARQAAAEFVAAVGRKPGDLAAVAPAPVSKSESEAAALAVRNHPSVLQAQYSVAANELAIERAKTAYKPTVSLGADIGVDFNGNAGRSVDLSVGGPIYSGGALPSQVRQAMATRDQARAALHLASLGVQQSVSNAYASLQVARASLSSTDEQVRAARVAFEGIREEATLGARTTLDVLNAEQNLLSARANVITAQEGEVNASYAVLSAMGLLTAEHLNLDVQQYDPAAYYNLVKDAPAALSEQGQALDRVLRAIGQ
ncbi:TolC family outer membrane protein [Loktanella salsilacus]|nr:TolC family outer membrane protein [Loktanella salsilacus]